MKTRFALLACFVVALMSGCDMTTTIVLPSFDITAVQYRGQNSKASISAIGTNSITNGAHGAYNSDGGGTVGVNYTNALPIAPKL